MNLRTLRAFVEVVRQGGFSQAAEVVFSLTPFPRLGDLSA